MRQLDVHGRKKRVVTAIKVRFLIATHTSAGNIELLLKALAYACSLRVERYRLDAQYESVPELPQEQKRNPLPSQWISTRCSFQF
ncbi:hypothetical protein [Azohydromonas australica]|uniref:hypothetical protein n=1 Tax=Azohydromonas australica TaxID=364039 RepID=UPI0012EBAA6E|nr:hypothetical protein [Azohydromonas australica]